MDHADHVDLLRDGVPREVGTWADLGAGAGAFTLALADLLPLGSTIHAIDRDASALRELEGAFARSAAGRVLPGLVMRRGDFTRDLGLDALDGVVLANSLHFIRDKPPVLARVRSMLRPGGSLLLVEYDTDDGNAWVPHPISFESWRALAPVAGFSEPRLLATKPSRFLRRIFSAASARAD